MNPIAVDLDAAVARALALAGSGGRHLIGITGPPGAGKSTISGALVASVPADQAVVLPMDGFHLAQAELERLGRAHRKGAPDTFDAHGFVALLARVAAQHPGDPTVYAPLFRREIEEPIACAVPIDAAVPLVIVEGNYLLVAEDPWSGVRPHLTECWYADLPDGVRLTRLIARHVAHGRSPEAAAEWVHRSDETNARLIAATRPRADLVVAVP